MLESEGWKLNEQQFENFYHQILPDGLFLVTEKETNEIEATAVSLHNPKSSYYAFPFGGDIGFVVTNPNHRRKGLGQYVTAKATNKLIDAGYKCIRLVTNDHRLPALKTYIKLGFVPFLYSSDMEGRWQEVYTKLDLNFSKEKCIASLKKGRFFKYTIKLLGI
jgi:mycothiol synthase